MLSGHIRPKKLEGQLIRTLKKTRKWSRSVEKITN